MNTSRGERASADAALQAASEAARAAGATADAAAKVLEATHMEADARRLEETQAIEAEAKARAAYHQAVERRSHDA